MKIKSTIRVIFTVVLVILSIEFYAQAAFQKEVEKIVKYDTDITWQLHEGAWVCAYVDGEYWHALLGSFSNRSLDSLIYQSRFQIGGLSKTMTAYAIREWEQYHGENDTVNLCLTHTSGLPKIPNNWNEEDNLDDPYQLYSDSLWKDFITSFKFRTSPHLYSHLNYVWLGKFYHRQTGQTIAEWWQDRFPTYSYQMDTMPGLDRVGRPQKIWESGIYQPSLGLLATPYQLQSWLQVQLNDTIAALNHEIKAPTSYHENIFVGDAWHILDYEKYPIYMHSGRAGGHHSFMGFVKETQTGVIILSNCMRGTEDLGTLVLRMINQNWKKETNGKEKE